MNFQQLRYVSALATCGSFWAAAEACHVTQPTLSNGIALVEDELGLKLFLRTTRKVSVSEAGKKLLPVIAEVLNAQKSLLALARELKEPGRQLLRIGISPIVGLDLISRIVEPFLRDHPTTEIIFRELNLKEMMLLMQAGQLEFVFGPAQARHSRSIAALSFKSEPLVYLSQRQSAASRSGVTLAEIASETFVMVQDTCGLTSTVRSLFSTNRLKLNEYSGSALNYQVLQEWSSLGIGAAILPRSKVAAGMGTEIFRRKGSRVPLTITYEACWPREMRTPSAVRLFSDYLKQKAPPLAAGLHS